MTAQEFEKLVNEYVDKVKYIPFGYPLDNNPKCIKELKRAIAKGKPLKNPKCHKSSVY